MKKILLILAVVLFSCSEDTIIDEPPCECTKTITKEEAIETKVAPYYQIIKTIVGTEKVICQDETKERVIISQGKNFGIYYEIKCK